MCDLFCIFLLVLVVDNCHYDKCILELRPFWPMHMLIEDLRLILKWLIYLIRILF